MSGAKTQDASGITYDAGMILAAGRGSRLAWAVHDEVLDSGIVPTVPTVVVAQAWRDGRGQALVARLLRGCHEEPLGADLARAVGRFAAATTHSDVADLVVAEGALRRGDRVVTTDPRDMARCGVDPRRLVVV